MVLIAIATVALGFWAMSKPSNLGRPRLDVKKLSALPPDVNLPIYPEAENVEYYSMAGETVFGVSLESHQRHPTYAIMEYYDEELARSGWTPFCEEYYKYGDRKWKRHTDLRKGSPKEVERFVAYWVNPDKTKRSVLILRYYGFNSREPGESAFSNKEPVFVTYQEMPFFILPAPTNG